MELSLSDPLTRTFLTFPIFTVLMFVSVGLRFGRGWRGAEATVPILYALTLAGVLGLWAQAAGTMAAGHQVADVVALTVPGIAIGVVLVALTPPLYLVELAMAEGRERIADWWGSRGSPRLAAFRDASVSLTTLVAGVAATPPPTPMTRAEAYDVPRILSRSPAVFAGISIVTAVAEELLFRGVMLDLLRAETSMPAAVAGQAGAYAVNHVPFGAVAVIGKFVFGCVLGLSAILAGSILPAIAAHLFFQFLVWRRFRRIDA